MNAEIPERIIWKALLDCVELAEEDDGVPRWQIGLFVGHPRSCRRLRLTDVLAIRHITHTRVRPERFR